MTDEGFSPTSTVSLIGYIPAFPYKLEMNWMKTSYSIRTSSRGLKRILLNFSKNARYIQIPTPWNIILENGSAT
jgi:hypothetical protein